MGRIEKWLGVSCLLWSPGAGKRGTEEKRQHFLEEVVEKGRELLSLP
jgi:hypothetical protein